MSDYLTVSHVTQYLKLKFDRDPYLERIYLTGEVSNYRKRPKHQYFSLKDDKAVIQVTIWAGVFKQLGFEIEEGMKINVIGRIQLYEPSGSYSLIVEKAEPDGIGALAVQFEQLKKKLAAAGYFDAIHKQELPQFPKRIGVVTSESGAVIRDIITTVSRRFSGVEILLFPTKVQGEGAAEAIAQNIARANECSAIDLLIIGRGGGSIEDLWAFNEQIVVEAIFESRLPVISSVGHETDTTLSDLVADKRAATPTAAAELATPVSKADLLAWLVEQEQRSYQATLRGIQQYRELISRLSQTVIFRQPERLYDTYLKKLDSLTENLQSQMKQHYRQATHDYRLLNQALENTKLQEKLYRYKERLMGQQRLLLANMTSQYDSRLARFDKAQEALLSLDTSRIIARGYALLKKDNQIISSITGVSTGDHLTVQLKDGHLAVEVKDAN